MSVIVFSRLFKNSSRLSAERLGNFSFISLISFSLKVPGDNSLMVLMSSLRRLSCASRVSLAFVCSLSVFVFADGALSFLEALGALSDLLDDGVVFFDL